jgi:predicted CopG family antitoxin
MQKKLTVTIDEEVYEGLRTVIGPRKISRFIEELVRWKVSAKLSRPNSTFKAKPLADGVFEGL